MSGREEKISHMRLSVVQYAALGIFLILSYGLWSLQIRKSEEYESMAQQNRVHKVPILAPRIPTDNRWSGWGHARWQRHAFAPLGNVGITSHGCQRPRSFWNRGRGNGRQ